MNQFLIIYFVFLSISSIINAQDLNDTGKITGKVVNSKNDTPISYATISIFSFTDSSFVTGCMSDNNGSFSISNIDFGKYYIKLDFMGFKSSIVDSVVVNSDHTRIGTIRLAENIETLSEVEIIAQTEFVNNSIDKKSYNIETLITNEGSNTSELLLNIPSVNVDIDGIVSLRGSENVTVLINGKYSGFKGEDLSIYLESLPSDIIETIEVITNPSVKYDPDGMAGIINIVTKKNKLEGFNTMLSTSIGTDSMYSASGMFSLNKKKWSVFTNFSTMNRKKSMLGTTHRETGLLDSVSILDQNSVGERVLNSNMINAGFDYSINQKNDFSASVMYNIRGGGGDEIIESTFLDDNTINNYIRSTDKDLEFTTIDLNAAYKKTFNKNGILSFNIKHSISDSDSKSLFSEQDYDTYFLSPISSEILQKSNTNSKNKLSTINIDFSKSLNNNNLIELGYQSTFKNNSSDFIFYNYSDLISDWIKDDLQSNNFQFEESNHSIYSIYKQNIGNFGCQFGLRTEMVQTEARLINSEDVFNNDYISFFPSIHTSYLLSGGQQIKASYSRRINRPNERMLNPFPNYSDPLNIRIGNPYLKPEYVDSYELEYIKIWDNLSLSTSAYLKNVNDAISHIKYVEDNISITTYENFGNTTNYGLELILNSILFKWWNFTLSSNAYKTVIDGTNIGDELNNEGFSFSSKFLSTFKLPKDLTFQFSCNYNSPIVIAQGEISDMYSCNLAIKKKIFKNRGSISLKFTDIFNTNEFSFITSGDTFYQESSRKRESQAIYLSFSYSFGNLLKRNDTNGLEKDNSFQGVEID